MLRWTVGMALCLLLAGCVAPPALPSAQPFVSPLARPHKLYLPTFLADWFAGQSISPKKGVSLACGGGAARAREVQQLRVSWIWNWGTDPPLFPGIESIPAIWDASYIGKPLGGNSEWVLGFNEPDISNQANMTPEAAAIAWRKLEATYPYRRKTSPQVIYPGDWLERWYAAYVDLYGQPPRLDALAIHTYIGNSSTAYIAQVQRYIALAQQWGVPEVWVTEWAMSHGLDRTLRDTMAEMSAYVNWLEAEPMIARYAPWTNRVECMDNEFGFRYDSFADTPLFAHDGRLTDLGRTYQALP
jgi:hypothetical protein